MRVIECCCALPTDNRFEDRPLSHEDGKKGAVNAAGVVLGADDLNKFDSDCSLFEFRFARLCFGDARYFYLHLQQWNSKLCSNCRVDSSFLVKQSVMSW